MDPVDFHKFLPTDWSVHYQRHLADTTIGAIRRILAGRQLLGTRKSLVGRDHGPTHELLVTFPLPHSPCFIPRQFLAQVILDGYSRD